MRFEVKDMNGKTFSGNTEDLFRVTGDFQDSVGNIVQDSTQRARIMNKVDIKFVLNDGDKAVDPTQVIADAKAGKTNIIAIEPTIEATHSGKNHNYCIYYEESMEKDAESFINPFEKPMLKNHNSYSGEPIGRIKAAWFGPSQLTDERSAIHVKSRITDKDSIHKFLDGRYTTVSIGGSMGTVTCSVCGKTILKDGKLTFCGHWKGETYKDQICYWGVKDIEYNELSVVNVPADDFAQVTKVSIITDDGNKDTKGGKPNTNSKEEGNDMDNNSTNSNVTTTDAVDSGKKSILDIIDQMLGTVTATPDATAESAPQTEATDAAQAPAAEEPQTAGTEVNDATESKELEDAKAKIVELEAKITETEDALKQAQEELEASKKATEEMKTENDSLKEKCIALATANKEMIADGIIEKEIAGNTIAEDAKDSRKEELMKMSVKELNALASDMAKQQAAPAPREQAQAQNPTLATEDSNGSDVDTNKTADNSKTKRTVDDFANEIVGKLIK